MNTTTSRFNIQNDNKIKKTKQQPLHARRNDTVRRISYFIAHCSDDKRVEGSSHCDQIGSNSQ